MRAEWRAIAVVLTLLLAGALGASRYAAVLCPYYVVAVSTLGADAGWQVVSVNVRDSNHGPGRVVALTADLYSRASASQAAARVVSEVQVGAVAEGPVVLFSILALWPLQAGRRRWRLLLAGVAALLLLELVTTVPQLMHAMAAVAAMAAGEPDHTTAWDRWTSFLEGGGRFAVECALAVLTAAFAGRARRRPA